MPSSSPANAKLAPPKPGGRSYPLYGASLLIVAGLVFLAWGKINGQWEQAPILLLAPVAYLLLIFMTPEAYARDADPVWLDRHWEAWLRTFGCAALLLLVVAATTLSGSFREIWKIAVYAILSIYLAAASVIIVRRNFGPLAHAWSSAVMRENSSGVPAWFRPIYFLGAPARLLARKLFPGVSLGLGSILTLSSLLLMTSGHFGCNDVWYRGYQLFTLRARWITAENLATGLSQTISDWAALAAYTAGLLAAVLAWFLLARAHVMLARITLVLAGAAALFVIADLFAIYYVQSESSSVLPIISLSYVGLAALTVAAGARAPSPAARDVAGLRAAALFMPALLLSYGVLIFVATLRVWGFIAYFFGVQLVWWGALQTSRSLRR
jgi:hypothetical protein